MDRSTNNFTTVTWFVIAITRHGAAPVPKCYLHAVWSCRFYTIHWFPSQFQEERLTGAAGLLTPLQYCIQSTIDYTRQRSAFGKPILDNQYVHYRLAELETEVECLKALTYRAAGGCDATIHTKLCYKIILCKTYCLHPSISWHMLPHGSSPCHSPEQQTTTPEMWGRPSAIQDHDTIRMAYPLLCWWLHSAAPLLSKVTPHRLSFITLGCTLQSA